MTLLGAISISIVAAAVLALIARRFRQPLILGYIVSGALLGPHVGLGVITDEHSIELISEIGLILLLFIIGLEISLPRLLQAGRSITVSGLLQVPICAGLAWLALGGVAAATGAAFDRLYLAVATSMSSTLIVVKLLSDKFEMGTFGGRVTVGILIFQDLWAIAFISLQPNLQHLQAALLIRSFAAGLGLLAAAALLARFVLPRLFRFMATSPELMLVSSMAWCFLVAGVAARAGLSAAMGALIAGVVIASFPYSIEVVSRVSGVRDFFITLFFVALGLKVPEPSLLLLLMALGGAAFVILSRFVAMYPIFAFLGLDTRTAGVVAINLGQISEFSLVIFSLGIGLGHVSQTAASLILYTLLVTSVLSTYGILYNHAVASWLAGIMERMGLPRWLGGKAPQQEGQPSHGHDVARDLFLLGVSREGLALIEHFERHAPAMKQRIVAVDFNPETLEILERHGVEHYYGDISNVESLRHAGIERASIVISGISDWFLKGTSNLQLLHEVRALTRSAKVVLTADTLEAARRLYAAGADYVLIPQALTAEHLFRIFSDSSPDALARARELQTAELLRHS
jgi:Kef-type K+ transport system membrane component KefB/Trk K+ transport system NAD-binding subunit